MRRHWPNFKEFYPKSLIPMGTHDQSYLVENWHEGAAFSATHWLIAYEWNDENGRTGWRIIVYPATANGTVYYDAPFYITDDLMPYEKAHELAIIAERYSVLDTLTSEEFREASH